MSRVITAPEEITASRLTAILRRARVLRVGHVESVKIVTNPAFNSAICHLHVDYSSNSSSEAPKTLLFKRNLPEAWAREAGKLEVGFYTETQSLGDELPMIVPCYDAAYEPTTGDSHLLLLDLSLSHEALVTRNNLIALHGVPDEERSGAAVDAVARFHAYWWEHPSLTDGIRDISGWYGTRERFEDRIERRRREWTAFRAGLGADLPTDLLTLYEYVLERLPVLWERGLGQRITRGKDLTLVHGDCYLSQFLYPRNGVGTTYLVDWQGAWADIPTIDLVRLFAAFWTPEQRHEEDRERRLLERYLTGLQSCGVVGYDWQALRHDYQLLLIYMVLHPVWDAVNGSRREYWWATMRCLTSAFRDWRCEELLA